MSSAKIAKAAYLRGRLDRTGYDAFERRLADLLGQGFGHRVSGLADGDHQDARIGLQIVKIFADAQHAALAVHMPGECFGDRSLGQRVAEDLASSVAHFVELRFALGVRHGQDYKDRSRTISCRTQISIASRSSRNRPSKK